MAPRSQKGKVAKRGRKSKKEVTLPEKEISKRKAKKLLTLGKTVDDDSVVELIIQLQHFLERKRIELLHFFLEKNEEFCKKEQKKRVRFKSLEKKKPHKNEIDFQNLNIESKKLKLDLMIKDSIPRPVRHKPQSMFWKYVGHQAICFAPEPMNFPFLIQEHRYKRALDIIIQEREEAIYKDAEVVPVVKRKRKRKSEQKGKKGRAKEGKKRRTEEGEKRRAQEGKKGRGKRKKNPPPKKNTKDLMSTHT